MILSRHISPSREPLISDTSAITYNDLARHKTPLADIDQTGTNQTRRNLKEFDQLFRAGENAFKGPTTTKRELWSYYLYYNGDNGVGPGAYTQALFQFVLTRAGWDPSISPIELGNCRSGDCVVAWGSGTKSVASVVLIANGLCFAIMTIVLISLGSAADYGRFGRWMFLIVTVLCWIFQYAMVAITSADQWPTAMGLYIASYFTYGTTLVLYAAIFPSLARCMPHVRQARQEDLSAGKITQDEYDEIESMERSHISNVSTAHSNIGYFFTLTLSLAILLPMESNPLGKNIALGVTNTYWILLGVWWFIYQQPRPGPSIPKGSNYLTIGWKQVFLALKEVWYLSQTFTYLLASFFLADGLNTTSTLVSVIQNEIVSFSFLQITFLGLTQASCSIISTFGFWHIQKYFGIRTKIMFVFTNIFSVLIPFYGTLGLWTSTIGYHRIQDLWLYNIFFGLFQAPYYAYAQAMMSELTPRGYEALFFGLFGMTNRASSIIGPNVIQVIINKSNNTWMGFPLLVALCAGASTIIWFVDVEKGREECRIYAEKRKLERASTDAGSVNDDSSESLDNDGDAESVAMPAEHHSCR